MDAVIALPTHPANKFERIPTLSENLMPMYDNSVVFSFRLGGEEATEVSKFTHMELEAPPGFLFRHQCREDLIDIETRIFPLRDNFPPAPPKYKVLPLDSKTNCTAYQTARETTMIYVEFLPDADVSLLGNTAELLGPIMP